jgi:hypothetical protein
MQNGHGKVMDIKRLNHQFVLNKWYMYEKHKQNKFLHLFQLKEHQQFTRS